jgi:hypothetical protein
MWYAPLIGGLIEAAGTLVGRVLISLGFAYVVFSGVDTGIAWARDGLLAALGGLPAIALGVARVCKVGTCISILTSALSARLLLNGLQSGTLRRLVVRS